MSLFDALTNVAKAGIAVAVSPVALVADVVTLPASAEAGGEPFGRTRGILSAAGECITAAVKPEGKTK